MNEILEIVLGINARSKISSLVSCLRIVVLRKSDLLCILPKERRNTADAAINVVPEHGTRMWISPVSVVRIETEFRLRKVYGLIVFTLDDCVEVVSQPKG